jgi:hypothetical protein
MQHYDKPVRVLMKEMSDAFALQPGQAFTRQQAIDWFAQKYQKIKPATIVAHLVKLSTNAPSRIHYNLHPGADDLFYRIDPSHFRLYDRNHDGSPIYTGDQSPRKLTIDEEEERTTSDEFAYERDLQGYLAKNLPKIESGLKLYEDGEITGIEFDVGGRRIDILAVSLKGDLVVIELKVSRGYDRAVGQLMRYMAWIRNKLAEPGQKVRGIIVAREITEDLLLACSMLQDVQLFEYEMSVALKPVNLDRRT